MIQQPLRFSDADCSWRIPHISEAMEFARPSFVRRAWDAVQPRSAFPRGRSFACAPLDGISSIVELDADVQILSLPDVKHAAGL